jgi:transcriptional regulator with XRE-family HTH domain
MDSKYIGQWLRRVRKELAISGRLSEIACLLEMQYPGTNPAWSAQLRHLRNGDWEPDPDQLTCIDAVLSRPLKLSTPVAVTPSLFCPMPQ